MNSEKKIELNEKQLDFFNRAFENQEINFFCTDHSKKGHLLIIDTNDKEKNYDYGIAFCKFSNDIGSMISDGVRNKIIITVNNNLTIGFPKDIELDKKALFERFKEQIAPDQHKSLIDPKKINSKKGISQEINLDSAKASNFKTL